MAAFSVLEIDRCLKNLFIITREHDNNFFFTANPAHPFHKFGSGNLQTLLEGPKEKNLDLK